MTTKEMELAQQSAAVNPAIEVNQLNDEVNSEIDESIDELPADQEQKNSDVEEFESLKRELSGLTSDQIELVKSIKDQEDRQKAIELAKKQRADKDRLHLELGNLKRELSLIQQERQNAIKQQEPEEDEEYLTETEKRLRQHIKLLENQYQSKVQAEYQEIIDEFQANNPDVQNYLGEMDGFIRYLNTMKGSPKTAKAANERLMEAYKMAKAYKAPEIESELESLKKENEERQAKIEEAKKLKKFTRNSSAPAKLMTPEEKTRELINKFYESR